MDVEELALFLAQSVVDEPQAVRIERRGQMLLIRVAPGEEGRVIGRGGRVIQAIRTLIRGSVPGERINIDLYGNGRAS